MGLGQNLLDTPTLRSGAYAQTLTQTVTTSGNVTVPAWATKASVTAIGGGAGGAGAGSTSSTTASQVGGAAGGPGGVTFAPGITVTPGGTVTVVIGAGGAGGAGGAAGGNNGSNSSAGGTTTVSGAGFAVTGPFGGAAVGGTANDSNGTGNYAGAPSQGSNYTGQSSVGGTGSVWLPGFGSQPFVQYPAAPLNGLAAGEAGQSTNFSTGKGGLGGYACQLSDGWGHTQQAFSGTGGSTTANGQAGQTATLYGCGGGGGGGGASGGAGGNGGNGAPGVVIIEWRSA